MPPQTSQQKSGNFTWVPTPEQLARANATRLATSLDCGDYGELHRVSIEEPDRFWRAVAGDLGIPLSRDWDEVLDGSRSVVIREAFNRMVVQMAVLYRLLRG